MILHVLRRFLNRIVHFSLISCQKLLTTQWRIQDFPEGGGAPTPKVGLFCKLFAEIAWKWKNLDRRGVGKRPTLGFVNATTDFEMMWMNHKTCVMCLQANSFRHRWQISLSELLSVLAVVNRPCLMNYSLNSIHVVLSVTGLAREVLRSQPSDIYAFGAAYFDNLLRAKSGKLQYWNIIYYNLTISTLAERNFFFNKNDFWEDGTLHRNVLCHKCCIKQNEQEMKNWIENKVTSKLGT